MIKPNSNVHKNTQKKRISNILKKCKFLCDDMISNILLFIGYTNGINSLQKTLLREHVYENYKQYRFQLYNMYCNKALEICNILYKKISNYNVVQIAKIIDKTNLFENIRDEFHIKYLKNRIMEYYNNLCKKKLLRYDYELSMNYYNGAFRKAIIHFLKFDYPSMDIERKKYMKVFDEICNLTLFYD